MTTQTIQINDTGKRRTSSVSAEETDKVNSGSAITLHGVEISVEAQAILNTKPAIGLLSNTADAGSMFSPGEVDHLGTHKHKWTIRGHLNQDSASDMAQVKQLTDLTKTKGYKTLSGDLPDWMDGDDDSSTVNVRFMSVRILHRSNSNILDYQLEAYETS